MTLEKRKQEYLKKLKQIKNDEFELLGGFTKTREKALFKHKVCGYEWYTTPYNLLKSKGTGCPKCQYRDKSYTTDEFKKKLKDKFGYEYELIEGQEYKNSREKLLFIHNKCGTEFKITSDSLFRSKVPCHKCSKENRKTKKKTTEQFKNELYNKHKDEYILVEGSEYKTALEKVRIIHTKCGYTWDVRASHILHTSKCPNCNESKGESLIKDILEDNNFSYIREYTFEDLKNVKKLPFDFALFIDNELVGLIEYDGSQHFIPFEHFGGKEKLRKTQYNDRKKNEYCDKNRIPLKRIKYDLDEKEVIREIEMFLNSIVKSKAESY
ncbi:hypothetical protein [Staphylococcus phage APTC_SA_12]|uniref:I-MsaI n=8 Tax=Kayvirus G1 TaxID=292029 RepID=I6XFH6_9CAUD|nr:hypothetical protein QLX38_gp165 [Staphylococcus phage Team1]YP_009781469.1 I-MsaI [Staphylococcus phage MSA6]YP_009782106.1 hypothetical protein QLX43_gp201 [Staphylococcus phage IME-SA1]YP_009782349.1 hypothetical protein QLX44_gp163 [Staphylococcus phage IME-SA2]YP_009782594.1 hypothetical protein QLX45_gp155 [Staphylococcus phage IME-SA118]YP_009782707.1 hypothetical protein QLX46_gp002 [Staphylococcus phage IME-SA119]ASR76895.1 hypothetical protein PhageJA1_084 [Staphylococcus phage J